MDEFKFDAPEVRGPRKRRNEDSFSDVPPNKTPRVDSSVDKVASEVPLNTVAGNKLISLIV